MSKEEPTETLDLDKNKDYLKYKKAIGGMSSDISKLLNCHLLAEYYLEQLILISLKRGDILLDQGHLGFSQKLLIVRSLDILKDDLLTSLKHLNRVRNLCSHSMDYTITESDLDSVGRPLGLHYTADIKLGDPESLINRLLAYLIGLLAGNCKVVFDLSKTNQ